MDRWRGELAGGCDEGGLRAESFEGGEVGGVGLWGHGV